MLLLFCQVLLPVDLFRALGNASKMLDKFLLAIKLGIYHHWGIPQQHVNRVVMVFLKL